MEEPFFLYEDQSHIEKLENISKQIQKKPKNPKEAIILKQILKAIILNKKEVKKEEPVAAEPEKKDGFDPSIVKEYGIEDNVLFLGERTDVHELYSIMDVFVLPSYREGIGISLLEASAMKRPIVATDVRGCREAVDDGKTGILVPRKNSEKLAEAILWMLSHPAEAAAMGERGRQKVEREFDENIVFERIEREYERVMK